LSGKSDSDVTGVIFIKSKLSKISPRIFSKFPNIENLDASDMQISIANASTIEVCGKLSYLDLSDNQISVIEDGFLSSCKNLEVVYIESNFIERITPCNNFMKTQKNLVEVSLLYNSCIDESGYAFDEDLDGKYQEKLVKPLMNCFTNYLDPPEPEVFYV
jgi:Leucine-rich repeat (LRR) protein